MEDSWRNIPMALLVGPSGMANLPPHIKSKSRQLYADG
jgi:hypothetical protein